MKQSLSRPRWVEDACAKNLWGGINHRLRLGVRDVVATVDFTHGRAGIPHTTLHHGRSKLIQELPSPVGPYGGLRLTQSVNPRSVGA